MDWLKSEERNFELLKEPIGMIKILEFFSAILAFATTTSFYSDTVMSIKCGNDTKTLKYSFAYPFVLNGESGINKDPCKTNGPSIEFYGNFSHPAQFFVFVGVMAFLYCVAASVLYIFFNHLYTSRKAVVRADFIVTAVFSFLWLVGSIAWSAGVISVKTYTAAFRLMKEIENDGIEEGRLKAISDPTFGGLNFSLILGYMNAALWASNLWFILKELRDFKDDQNADIFSGDASHDPAFES